MKRGHQSSSSCLLLVLGLAAGCGGSSSGTTSDTGSSPSAGPAHLTIWVGWSARELGIFKDVVAGYTAAHPNVTVTVRGSVNDDQIIAAIRGGNAPDVVSSFTSSNVGAFTSSGHGSTWLPTSSKDNISTSIFTPATMYYTQYKGVRTALPLLADTWGLYYNKAMFAKAGITGPPKTISELVADAKKLTVRNSDGSLKVVGFDPFSGFYDGTPPMIITMAHYFGAKFTDEQGHSILSKDPGWKALFQWQKDLVDWYGYDNLVRWQAAQGDQFSSSNAFEIGKMAMTLDGEWRWRSSPPSTLSWLTPRPGPRHRHASRALRFGLRERHHHRHPEGLSRTPRRHGTSSSTSRPTPTPWCSSRTASATSHRHWSHSSRRS